MWHEKGIDSQPHPLRIFTTLAGTRGTSTVFACVNITEQKEFQTFS